MDTRAIAENIKPSRIMVVGDVMLDRYVFCQGEPYRVTSQLNLLGGAGAVAKMCAELGSNVRLYGVKGNDIEGQEIRKLVNMPPMIGDYVMHEEQTTVKTRVVSANGVTRFDCESRLPIQKDMQDFIAHSIKSDITSFNCVVVSDYGKGVCTPVILSTIIEASRKHGVPVLVDPSRGKPWSHYIGALILKCTRDEYRENHLKGIGKKFATFIETDGARGMTVNGNRISAEPVNNIIDATGCGDQVIATIAACINSDITVLDACRLASVAAAIKCGKYGAQPTTLEELKAYATNKPASRVPLGAEP